MSLLFQQRLRPYFKKPRRKIITEDEVGAPVFYGYCRVSDPKQDGNSSTKTQPDQLRSVYDRYWKDTHELGDIVSDIASGSKLLFRQRPQGLKLWEKMRRGDVLAVAAVDRFSRSMRHGLAEAGALVDRGVRVIFLDMGGADVSFDGSNHFLLASFLYVAEMEAKSRSRRASEHAARYKLEVAAGLKPPRSRRMDMGYGWIGTTGRQDLVQREFTRAATACHSFAAQTFGFTKCDGRHRWLMNKYGLGIQRKDYSIPCVPEWKMLINWMNREHALQIREGTYPIVVDEPWRRDYEAGVLGPIPETLVIPKFRKPINQPGE
jgi:DNA invertase Pin-like site-specific DNA recombinase